MSHAGPPRADDAPAVPEPTFAERARTLAYLGRTGTLAPRSRRHPGHPFASVMPYALDDAGRPVFLISTMAMHTQNLEADARASLLVMQPDWTGDPLAAGRLTLMGDARRVPDPDAAAARERYLARHERARYWADFEDFGLWRLDVADLYYVGGFAAMDWVTAADYAAARPRSRSSSAPAAGPCRGSTPRRRSPRAAPSSRDSAWPCARRRRRRTCPSPLRAGSCRGGMAWA